MITWLRYCPHNELLIWLCRGWMISDELHGTSHGSYSVLLAYHGEQPPT